MKVGSKVRFWVSASGPLGSPARGRYVSGVVTKCYSTVKEGAMVTVDDGRNLWSYVQQSRLSPA